MLADASVEPPLDRLFPSLVLPFPVAPMPPTEQARCVALEVPDLDGDLKPDHVDMTVSLLVRPMGETAQVDAGYFTDVAHAQTIAHLTITSTSHGSLTMDATQDDWYAHGVGRVVSLIQLTASTGSSSTPVSESMTVSLEAYSAPPAAAATPMVKSTPRSSAIATPVAPAAPVAPAGPLQEAALAFARKLLGAGR